MTRLLLAAGLCGLPGCGSPPAPPPADPNIHVKDSMGGGVGPINAGRGREYDGPASQAPDWAKPRPKAGR